MDTSFSINPSLDRSTELEVSGWVKLKILYSTEFHNGVSYLCWKVNGTDQVFRILAAIVYENHGLDYSGHFLATLVKFREDYLTWEAQNFPEDWMKRYQRMFHNLILR